MPAGSGPQTSRSTYRSASAIIRALGVVHTISTPEKSSPACAARVARYPSMPPEATRSGTSHARHVTPNTANAVSRTRVAPAPRRAISASVRIGATSQRACDRAPMATAAIIAPQASSVSPMRSGVVASVRCWIHAPTSRACAANARSSPGTSLIGRAAVNQNSGAVTASTVAATARPSRAAVPTSCSPTLSSRLNKTKSGNTANAPDRALTSASARASVAVPGGEPNAAMGLARSPRAMITGYPGGCG